MQTIALPGTIFLSIILGYLYSYIPALLLISFCSTTGSFFCYLISDKVLKSCIKRRFQKKLNLLENFVKDCGEN